MKCKSKNTIVNNHTLDKYLKPTNCAAKETVKKTSNKIRVPPSSGLPPLQPPTANVVLRYPIKPQFREYQQEIVASCICNNTLVCLPTGLGKTHIAAILIANFSRWFPQQKIVFLAPTRPLVRQQVSALRNMQDQISKEKILQVNGQLPARKRQQLYQSNQVIFATPQTIQNDLNSKRIDGRRIILMVIDECHRTVGNSSYTQIIRFMNGLDVGFRVVGLSATPGGEVQKIQEVVFNLNIKKIIYKDQQDPQVKKYLHQKTIHQVQIPETNIIKESLGYLDKFASPSIGLLVKLQLIEPWIIRNGLSSTSFFLIREKFGEKINGASSTIKPLAYAALKILGFLLKCRKALTDQGYQTFKSQFFKEIEPSKIFNKHAKEPQKQQQDSKESQLLQCSLQSVYEYYPQESKGTKQNQKSGGLPSNFKKSMQQSAQYKRLFQIFHQSNAQMHPKLIKLAQILQSFFNQKQGKVMIFTQLRLSAQQIKDYLQPITIIKSQLFFGQSKTFLRQDEQTGQNFYLQLKQKQQIQVIDRFKRGDINTLISTSIGEQGLDIGEVDCIICYDGGNSPIRAIQRRGRTGRKRAGEVYILLMEGKESTDYKKGFKRQSKMKEILKKNSDKFQYYPFNTTLFDQGTNIPIQYYQNQLCNQSNKKSQKKIIEVKQNNSKDKKATKKKKGKAQGKIQQQKQQQQQKSSFQLKITTITNLLDKYHQEQDISKVTAEQSVENQLIQIQKQQELSENEEKTQLSFKQSIQMDEFTENTLTQNSFLAKIEEIPIHYSLFLQQQDEDDEDQVIMQYYKQRQCQSLQKQQDSHASFQANKSDSMDSMQSDELISILQNFHKKHELSKYLQNEQ